MKNQMISTLVIYPDDRDPNINVSFSLREGENIVGSSHLSDIRFSYPSISERHVKLVLSNGKIGIEDLGSPLGTFRMTSTNPRQKLKSGTEYELEAGKPFYLANKYKCVVEIVEKGMHV
jgi:hypothetical protein